MEALRIAFLDHVAIRVMNIEKSARWYAEVLGLKRHQLPEWGSVPILMLAGKSGVALFPASAPSPSGDYDGHVRIDHFAFNMQKEDFAKAPQHFRDRGIPFTFQDHLYFHSLYLKDPDGHTVELTTLQVPAADFYRD